jgi:hypothetical protein
MEVFLVRSLKDSFLLLPFDFIESLLINMIDEIYSVAYYWCLMAAYEHESYDIW